MKKIKLLSVVSASSAIMVSSAYAQSMATIVENTIIATGDLWGQFLAAVGLA